MELVLVGRALGDVHFKRLLHLLLKTQGRCARGAVSGEATRNKKSPCGENGAGGGRAAEGR
eukprot:4912928-Prymnesium_polylepis.1